MLQLILLFLLNLIMLMVVLASRWFPELRKGKRGEGASDFESVST
jgi:hypothetical protein